MFEYKYVDIKDLVEICRGARDVELCLSPKTFQGPHVGILDNAKAGLVSSHREPDGFASSPSGASQPILRSTPSERKARKPVKSKSLSLDNPRPESSARHKHSRTLSISILSPTSNHHRQSLAEETVEMRHISTPHTSTPRETLNSDNMTTPTSKCTTF